MNQIVCEYSTDQRAFHVETMSEAIQHNRAGILSQRPADYLIFAVCSDFEEADAACREFRKMLGERTC